jgi:hypothetical protein
LNQSWITVLGEPRPFRHFSTNDFVCASVIKRVGVTARAKLSAFDRVGIVVITLLGTCIGLEIALASDIKPTPILVLLFPGLLIGFGVGRILGITAAGVLVCAATNGAAYGLLLYGWYRLSSALAYSNKAGNATRRNRM